MGKLALYGALGGAAKGWEKSIMMREERERGDIDHKRQVALERLRAENQLTLAKARGDIEAGHIDQRGAIQIEAIQEGGKEQRLTQQAGFDYQDDAAIRDFILQQKRDSTQHGYRIDEIDRGKQWDANRQDDQQEFMAWQQDATRATQTYLGELQVWGSHAASSGALGKGGMKAYEDRIEQAVKRYKPVTLKKGESIKLPNGGSMTMKETDVPAVYDELKGIHWVSYNGMLFQPNQEGNYSRKGNPTREEIQGMLHGDPEIAAQPGMEAHASYANRRTAFLDKYGFLPIEILEHEKNMALEAILGDVKQSALTSISGFQRPDRPEASAPPASQYRVMDLDKLLDEAGIL